MDNKEFVDVISFSGREKRSLVNDISCNVNILSQEVMMDLKVHVYTADVSLLAPKEAFGKFFIPLGSKHNYGTCYEMIMWINEKVPQVEKPYFSLIYAFEFRHCKLSHSLCITDAIKQLKEAIKGFPSTLANYSLHRDYMMLSAKNCLEELLIEYSFHRYRNCMAKKIQRNWLEQYYNPSREICKRIIMRQFEKLNEDTYTHLLKQITD
jgi:hypothetical protein